MKEKMRKKEKSEGNEKREKKHSHRENKEREDQLLKKDTALGRAPKSSKAIKLPITNLAPVRTKKASLWTFSGSVNCTSLWLSPPPPFLPSLPLYCPSATQITG